VPESTIRSNLLKDYNDTLEEMVKEKMTKHLSCKYFGKFGAFVGGILSIFELVRA
jgi:nitrate/nitrite transporter NarK